MLKERRRGRAAAARVASREEDMSEKMSVRVGPGSKIERPREERQGEDKAVEGKVAVEEECMPASRFLPLKVATFRDDAPRLVYCQPPQLGASSSQFISSSATVHRASHPRASSLSIWPKIPRG